MVAKTPTLVVKTPVAVMALAAGAALSILGLACSSSSSSPEPADGNAAAAAKLKIFPPKIYSGFDGQNKYRAPVIATGTGEPVTWSISDPSLASLDPSLDGVVLTTKKAGTATLSARVGTKTVTATFTVNAYTPAQYNDGKTRYTTDSASGPACGSCHGPGKDAPDHTPTAIDQYTDEQVVKTIQTGIDPEGQPLKQDGHTWPVNDAEKAGLLPYLRALEPKGFPAPGGTDE